ncbi:MAG TPA: circularly permuted type 2 ATP-grasp protein [Paracoccaceae bacterium]|nr:circularly permuted type 2 ATP-grasp protein [Paracoccaceae bacterium]
MATAPRTGPDPLAALLADYRPPPGVADELRAEGGALRPVWRRFMAQFAALSPEQRAARFARGQQYLRDTGVFYRHYGEAGSTERDWPLSPLPVILSETEWHGIEAGLIQRADLLEAVMADLYGPGRLVAEGLLPAAVVAQNAEWLRPLVGVAPAGGHFLHFIAFDIARNPDGSWFVLGDRTQAPSGAGFALENRVATSRVFPELFQRSNVHRLAGFFRQFRDALEGLRQSPGSRLAILTPGPLNDTYFEHAYIARYLGFMLLEGEDLTVQDGQAMVRTVEGPKPVDVLWRRLDAAFADPLELDPRSRIGTPGLTDALRSGRLAMVNALGSGLLETRAFLAFLPRICRALRKEPLELRNIATWWCGQETERDYVLDHIETLTIGPALANRLPFRADHPTVPGDADPALARWVAGNGAALVGQERARLSVTPVWEDGHLAARPMSLRVFLARTAQGWAVMPGGYARIGRTADATAIAIQEGGSVADVWVVSDSPVPAHSMVDQGTAPRPFRSALPARAADNLFWLGRYVERAEVATRLLRAYHLRLAESDTAETPLLAALADHLAAHGIEPQSGVAAALSDRLSRAVDCAGRLRDRFSGDGWQALNDLSALARGMEGLAPGDDAARSLGALLRRVAGLAGLVHENMYRSTGWRFLTMGRALERADAMAWALHRFADAKAPEGALDLLIELGDSVMTHRRRFPVGTGRGTVVDLLALDGDNPRAIAYQLADLRDQIAALPQDRDGGPMPPLARAVLLAQTGLVVLRPEEVDARALARLRADLAGLSDLVARSYFA